MLHQNVLFNWYYLICHCFFIEARTTKNHFIITLVIAVFLTIFVITIKIGHIRQRVRSCVKWYSDKELWKSWKIVPLEWTNENFNPLQSYLRFKLVPSKAWVDELFTQKLQSPSHVFVLEKFKNCYLQKNHICSGDIFKKLFWKADE